VDLPLFKNLIPSVFLVQSSQSSLKSIPVYLCFKEDLDSLGEISHYKNTYGSFIPGQIYASTEAGGLSYLYVAPRSTAKGLNLQRREPDHEAFLAGAEVAKALLTLPSDLRHSHQFCLTLLGSFKTLAVGFYDSFYSGFWVRGSHLGQFKKSQKAETRSGDGLESKNAPVNVLFSNVELKEVQPSQAMHLAESMLLTRSLVHFPANLLNPESYTEFASQLCESLQAQLQTKAKVTISVMDAPQLEKLECGLILAVGSAASKPPVILKLSYQPLEGHLSQKKPICLVGKGITFDTGGLDIKGSLFMRNMKKDMGGSACVLGAFRALSLRQNCGPVDCYLAVAENAVGSGAMRPGDVYTARNGVTVEIDNTDAEGRLVLADALCLAAESEPFLIIDVATLTGAARTSLGPSIDALFSNDTHFASEFEKWGKNLGDFVWQMPLFEDYHSMLDSNIADLTNCSAGAHAGAITAAQFLIRFVGKTPWVHLDSYMWTDKPTPVYSEAGATAKCVRLLVKTIEEISQK